MLFYIPFLLLSYTTTDTDAYLLSKLPSRFLYKREISSWKCAQRCFNRIEQVDYSSVELRHKRNVDYENNESQLAHHLNSYCEKSAEELSCVKTCPESDVKKQLLDLGMKVKTLTCSNVTVAVKTHNCVLGTQLLKECVAENCKTRLKELSKAVEERAQQGEHVIPGKQFCSLDSCSRNCMKKILPMSCGEESFSLYTSINDMANIIQSLSMFETKPSSENGILCIDRPIPETTENYEDDK